MLQRLQNNSSLDIQIVETDFPSVREVDLKLIELGKQLDAVIVTNDFNLNKVSQLRGVSVLNINELANALKPVVLPGEAMRVFILKEGKEYNQGVAYLDDGTMVVVDNARRLIGKNADIAVTSVLQTTAGKMIFGRLWEEAENGHSDVHRTNGGSRRPMRDSRSGPHPVRITDSEPIHRELTADRFQSLAIIRPLMNVAIIAAAGQGTRMASDRPKQFLELAGTPIIFHTLKAFEQCDSIQEVIVVLPAEESAAFLALAGKHGLRKLARVVAGGATRAESVKRGLLAIRAGDGEIVAVHDGVRPFVTVEEIARDSCGGASGWRGDPGRRR